MSDPVTEALVAIRAARELLDDAERSLGQFLRRKQATDRADLGRQSAPSADIASTLCHDYCPAEHVAPFCADSDEPPSRPVEATFSCLLCGTTTPLPHDCPAFAEGKP